MLEWGAGGGGSNPEREDRIPTWHSPLPRKRKTTPDPRISWSSRLLTFCRGYRPKLLGFGARQTWMNSELWPIQPKFCGGQWPWSTGPMQRPAKCPIDQSIRPHTCFLSYGTIGLYGKVARSVSEMYSDSTANQHVYANNTVDLLSQQNWSSLTIDFISRFQRFVWNFSALTTCNVMKDWQT